MKAFDTLMEIHRLDMRQGKDYLDAPHKDGLSLEVIEGKLKRRHWYFCTFRKSQFRGDADVILKLGGGDLQYLFEVEK